MTAMNAMNAVRQTGIVGPWRPAFAMSIVVFVATMSGIYVNEFQGTRVCNKARLFNASTSSYLLVTTGASVGHFVLQAFRVLAKLGSDDVVHHGSAVWMALLITGIQALTQYLSYHYRGMHLVCEDYFGVQTPAFLWVEWLSTVPVMFYLTSIMDVNKLALTPYDQAIVTCAALGLVCLCGLIFTNDLTVAVALLTFANVVFVYAQFSLHVDSYYDYRQAVAAAASAKTKAKDKTSASDVDDALTDLAIRVKQRRLVCAAFMNYFFTTFPVVYFLKTVDVIDQNTMFVVFAGLNFLAKGIFAMLVTEAHSQLLDPRTFLLFSEQAKADAARRAFVQYVTDEVRVPLKSVVLGTELLNHSDQITEADRATVRMIKDAGAYMAETLNDVLSTQKPREGRPPAASVDTRRDARPKSIFTTRFLVRVAWGVLVVAVIALAAVAVMLIRSRDTIPCINAWLKSFSPGDPVRWDTRAEPWTAPFRAQWRAVRDEYLAVAPRAPLFKNLGPFAFIDVHNKWRSVPLRVTGRDTPWMKHFPRTKALLDASPVTVETAMFSVLEPGAYLTPHVGPFQGVRRYHLGLVVPPGPCYLMLDGARLPWVEGDDLLFDDNYEHAVVNHAPHPRVVLFIDVPRRYSNFWVNLVNRILLRVLILSEEPATLFSNVKGEL